MKRMLALTIGIMVAISAMVMTPLSAPVANASEYYYVFINAATRRCLDDSFQYGLRTLPCNSSSYQEFRSGPNGKLFQNLNTGRCIDDSFQYGLRAIPCNGLAYQNWHLYSETYPPNLHFQNEATTGCLDDSFPFGLRTFGCNQQSYQTWTVPN